MKKIRSIITFPIYLIGFIALWFSIAMVEISTALYEWKRPDWDRVAESWGSAFRSQAIIRDRKQK